MSAVEEKFDQIIRFKVPARILTIIEEIARSRLCNISTVAREAVAIYVQQHGGCVAAEERPESFSMMPLIPDPLPFPLAEEPKPTNQDETTHSSDAGRPADRAGQTAVDDRRDRSVRSSNRGRSWNDRGFGRSRGRKPTSDNFRPKAAEASRGQ